MENLYAYVKALHIIFVVCWFAGLFYIVRLFVYYTEAQLKSEVEKNILSEQFRLMIYRLWYIISYPAAILATIFGLIMLYLNPFLLKMPWMHAKLGFIVLLWAYHFQCGVYVKQSLENRLQKTSKYFRLWNEGATLILFSVVFLVVLKHAVNWIYGVVGLFTLAILLMIGIKVYNKLRKQ
ncbi:CopD family protein [Capnocytophaga sp. ARDL2]|uniref:CopD family protein n=1 Tax=Capnocytophaga sp. ARDL2 TaxID=3238809 RepID=UPI003556AA18